MALGPIEMVILPTIIVIVIIPFFKAFSAAKSAEKFKIGLGLVLASQTVRLLIQIEDNTSQATNLLKSLQNSQ